MKRADRYRAFGRNDDFDPRETLVNLFDVAMVFAGCVASLDTVWVFADLFNGLMAVPNLIALIALAPVIRRLSDDLFRDPDTIRPRGTSYDELLTFRDGE